MNLNRRQQMLGLLAIAALVLLVGDRLLLTPLTASWKARAERLAALRTKVEQGEVRVTREAGIRETGSVRHTNTLPAEASVAQDALLKAFDRWSRDSRVGVSAIKPQIKRGNDDRPNLECRVDAFGNIASISRFLYEIEKDPLGVRIDAVELASRDDGGEQLTLGLMVNGLMQEEATKP